MMLEHLLYSAAIAIPVSLIICSRIEFSHSFVIILGSAFSPDIFKIIIRGSPLISIHVALLPGSSYLFLFDDYSHTLGALLIYAFVVGCIFSLVHLNLPFSILCAGIGYGAHLIADALVYRIGYPFFWPLSVENTSLGFFYPYRLNVLGVANDTVLLLGFLILLLSFLLAIIIRKYT